MITLSYVLAAFVVGIVVGCAAIPRGLMVIAQTLTDHAMKALRQAEEKMQQVEARAERASEHGTRLLATIEAREQALKTTQAKMVELVARGIFGGVEAEKTANLWQAVARNIATSHPEGAAVFLRVAAAHGLEVTQ